MAVTEDIEKQVPDYSVNYDDPRLVEVKSEENQALTEDEQTYGGMIDSTDKFINDQTQLSKDWADKQTALQQKQTDFAIEKIEQQKDQAEKDYKKEQSGAYVDWQKQSNQYGPEAEKMASAGLTNTGYSESSQVSMYNTYQNRVATARESYNRAVLNYDNAIKDAMLQNNAVLAELAYTALQQQLELSFQGFQYKNSLIMELSNQKKQTKQFYAQQWQNTLDQINTERQFNYNAEMDAKNQAISMMSAGIMPDKALLEAAGYSEAFAKNWVDSVATGKSSVNMGDGNYKAVSEDSDGGLYKINKTPGSTENAAVVAGIAVTNKAAPTFSDHDKAVEYMESKGIPSDVASGALPHKEWVRKKGTYVYTGVGDVEVMNYNTYTDYLTAYVNYCIEDNGK